MPLARRRRVRPGARRLFPRNLSGFGPLPQLFGLQPVKSLVENSVGLVVAESVVWQASCLPVAAACSRQLVFDWRSVPERGAGCPRNRQARCLPYVPSQNLSPQDATEFSSRLYAAPVGALSWLGFAKLQRFRPAGAAPCVGTRPTDAVGETPGGCDRDARAPTTIWVATG